MPPPPLPVRALPLLLLAFLAACTSRPPADDLPRAARQSLQQGLQLSRQKQHAAALQRFQQAYRLAPGHTPLLLNLGLAHGRLQEHGAAAAWLNAWLAAGLASPQRGAIEQQYRRDKDRARDQAMPLLAQALRAHFRQLPNLTDAEMVRQTASLATGMATAGDIYGTLKLLAECERLLKGQDRPTAWLASARDQSWEAYALTLALTRQLQPAEQARLGISNERRRQSFWQRLARAPDEAFRHLPPPLDHGHGWLGPLAARQLTPPLPTAPHAARLPLSDRSRLLAEAMTTAQAQLAATTASTPEATAVAANRFNLLLYLTEAAAAERHTAAP